MRLWPWTRPKVGRASPEATQSVAQANRALEDAKAAHQAAGERNRRADEVAFQLEQTRRRNHFAEAVARSMRKA